MLSSFQKSAHDRYAATVALLLIAFIVSPIVLFASSPTGSLAVLVAIAFSLLCSGAAWTQWKWRSVATIPSIIERPRWAK